MRTKKTAIKEAFITRTIKRTYVEFLMWDSEAKQAKEWKKFLNLEYTAEEAEDALKEMGYKVIEVTYIEVIEAHYKMSVSRFIDHAELV